MRSLQFSASSRSEWPLSGLAALAIAALGAALAASVFYSPLPLVLLVAVPALAYFLPRPYELFLVMVFLIPFNFIVPVGGVPVAAELLKVFLWIPFLLNTRSTAFLRSRYDWLIAIWIVILVTSIFRSNNLPFTVKEVVRLGSNIGLLYLTINLVDTRDKVLQVLQVLIVSAFLVALYGFYQFAIHDYGALFWIVNPRLDTSLSQSRYTFWEWRDRITSVLTSEMELGHYFNLCIPISAALWWRSPRRDLSSPWLWITFALVTGLVLTLTFGAWLALAATAVIFALLSLHKIRWSYVFAMLLPALLAFIAVVYSPVGPLIQMKLLASGPAGFLWDIATRLDIWAFAITVWWAHPIFGVGLGSYQLLDLGHQTVLSAWAPEGSTPHETYLYILAFSGVVGLFTILPLMWRNVISGYRLRHTSMGVIGVALSFCLVANLMGWLSDDSSFFSPHAGYLVWLILGLSEVVANLAVGYLQPVKKQVASA